MAQKTLFGGTLAEGKKKSPSKPGDSYIQIVGDGEINVRARNKEEALKKAQDFFETELRRCELWDQKNQMMNRWRGLMGAELVETSSKPKKEGVKLNTLKWKNNPKQNWIHNRELFGV